MCSLGELSGLYPSIEPFNNGYLSVSAGHRVYFEEVGNPGGEPIVVLHGGPGSGSSMLHRRLFDPAFFRVVIFDQRGCGRSSPYGGLEANDTASIIADIETLRGHVSIEKWSVFGNSWGTTLGMSYGMQYPSRCRSFVLSAIALPRPEKAHWRLFGQRHFFPEIWERFVAFLPDAERHDVLGSYRRRILSEDRGISLPAAYSWLQYLSGVPELSEASPRPGQSGSVARVVMRARLTIHYWFHNHFIDWVQFRGGLARISAHNAWISHGRYDMYCTPDNAYDLAALWPTAKLRIVENAGHSYRERANTEAIIESLNSLRDSLRASRPRSTEA